MKNQLEIITQTVLEDLHVPKPRAKQSQSDIVTSRKLWFDTIEYLHRIYPHLKQAKLSLERGIQIKLTYFTREIRKMIRQDLMLSVFILLDCPKHLSHLRAQHPNQLLNAFLSRLNFVNECQLFLTNRSNY